MNLQTLSKEMLVNVNGGTDCDRSCRASKKYAPFAHPTASLGVGHWVPVNLPGLVGCSADDRVGAPVPVFSTPCHGYKT